MIDEIPMGGPAQVPDFTPFFQRAKDKKPDVLFVFVPAGDHALAVVKTYGALGMKAAGIKLIGPGDITQDIKLQAMGDAAIGLITMHHYNADLDNPQNKTFVASWKKDYGPDSTPDFIVAAAMTAWRRSRTPRWPPRARWTATPRSNRCSAGSTTARKARSRSTRPPATSS